jgi:hypothetical protein
MKAIAAVLGLLVVAMAGGGVFYHRHASGVEAELRSEVSALTSKSATLDSDLAQAKASGESLSKELAQAKSDGQALEQQLAAARADGEALKTELATTKASLAESAAARETAAQRTDALAGLMTRKAEVEKLINEDMARATQRIREAEMELARTPSKAAFDKLRAAYTAAVRVADRTTPLLDDLITYMNTNADGLVGQEAVTSKIGNQVSKAKLTVPQWKASVIACQSALKEGSLGVYAKEEWQQTDLSVAKGTVVAVAATGQWTFGGMSGTASGPEGVEWNPDYRVARGIANGALLARVRGSEGVAAACPAFMADTNGRVELRINDSAVGDNSGTVQATLWSFLPLP